MIRPAPTDDDLPTLAELVRGLRELTDLADELQTQLRRVAEAGRAMRAAQTGYFEEVRYARSARADVERAGSREGAVAAALVRSKECERTFDRLVADVLDRALFGAGGGR